MNQLLSNKLTVSTFVAAIKFDSVSLLKAHLHSGKFSTFTQQQALNQAAMWNKPRTLSVLASVREDFLDKNSALNIAAAKGHVSCVASLEQLGGDVHSEEEFPFYLSAVRAQAGVSSYLLLKGPNFKETEYALKKSFMRGHKQFALDCLAFQAHAETPARALEWAMSKNKLSYALGAVKAGANPNHNNGELLFKAIAENKPMLVQLLVKLGADILARPEPVLINALKQSGSPEMLKMVYGIVRLARATPRVLHRNEGSPRGLKPVNVDFVATKELAKPDVVDAEFTVVRKYTRRTVNI